MATKKVTFTLDEATLVRLARVARCLDKPKSQVVREAVREYSERVGRLSEAERLAMLQTMEPKDISDSIVFQKGDIK